MITGRSVLGRATAAATLAAIPVLTKSRREILVGICDLRRGIIAGFAEFRSGGGGGREDLLDRRQGAPIALLVAAVGVGSGESDAVVAGRRSAEEDVRRPHTVEELAELNDSVASRSGRRSVANASQVVPKHVRRQRKAALGEQRDRVADQRLELSHVAHRVLRSREM